jgi:hypothetical protein
VNGVVQFKFRADQKKVLLEAATPVGAHAIRFYAPVMRLLELGLIEPFEGGEPTTRTNYWRLTSAGRELLLGRRWIK